MKKDFMKAMFLMLCAVFAFTFTACSDDDDPVDDAATQVAGAYTGELNVYMTATGDEPIATDTKTITLSKKTENTVDLVINNFTLTVFTLPVELGNDDTADTKAGVQTLLHDGDHTHDFGHSPHGKELGLYRDDQIVRSGKCV